MGQVEVVDWSPFVVSSEDLYLNQQHVYQMEVEMVAGLVSFQ